MNKRRILRKPKKFRFTLLHQWMVNNFHPCKVLDVGGGKGTLAYLLQQSGWEVTVVDPEWQKLPWKYKTLEAVREKTSENRGEEIPPDPLLEKEEEWGRKSPLTPLCQGGKPKLQKVRLKLSEKEQLSVKRITKPFSPEMVKEFDWIIGMHLHGANMGIIKACTEFNRDFLLFPCCVIDEPIEKKPGINWRESLIEYAESLGHKVKTVQLNFKGKNIGIYTDKDLKKREDFDVDLNKQILIADSEFNLEFFEIPYVDPI